MSIITLTTDFGLKDHFVGALKGKLFSTIPKATVIDISHNIDPFNTLQASYIVGAAYKSFPEGTIHIIGVDSEWSQTNKHLAVFWDNHFFVSADNGILSLLFKDKVPTKIVVLDVKDQNFDIETDLDIFVRAAKSIFENKNLNSLGTETAEIKQVTGTEAFVANDKKSIRGNIIYIDHFGNVVTNISKEIYQETAQNRAFEIPFRRLLNEKKATPITQIWNRYSEIVQSENYDIKMYDGSKLAVFNEAGFLEIAIYKSNTNTGSAATLLGLGFRDNINIIFKD